jgi:putative transposase
MSRDVDSNHNVTFDCQYHVVFCPKYRRKVPVKPIDARLKALLSEKATDIQVEIVEMEIMPTMFIFSSGAIRNMGFAKSLNNSRDTLPKSFVMNPNH